MLVAGVGMRVKGKLVGRGGGEGRGRGNGGGGWLSNVFTMFFYHNQECLLDNLLNSPSMLKWQSVVL